MGFTYCIYVEMALFLLKALQQDPEGKYQPANGVNAFFMFRDTQKDLGTHNSLSSPSSLSSLSPLLL